MGQPPCGGTVKWHHEARVPDYVSTLRPSRDGNHADRRLQVLLRLPRLWRNPGAETRGLLRVLLLRVGSVPANPTGVDGLLREPLADPRICGQPIATP